MEERKDQHFYKTRFGRDATEGDYVVFPSIVQKPWGKVPGTIIGKIVADKVLFETTRSMSTSSLQFKRDLICVAEPEEVSEFTKQLIIVAIEAHQEVEKKKRYFKVQLTVKNTSFRRLTFYISTTKLAGCNDDEVKKWVARKAQEKWPGNHLASNRIISYKEISTEEEFNTLKIENDESEISHILEIKEGE